jgi:hypothetical protein
MVHVGGVVVCVSYGIDFAIGLVLPSRVNKLRWWAWIYQRWRV